VTRAPAAEGDSAKKLSLHVTEAEAVVLGPLWRLGSLTPARLMQEVKVVQPWADTTIKTLLARLARKRTVAAERTDGVVRYRALIARDAYVEAEVRSLAERLFEGDEAALLAWLQGRR
jgi:BlaI family transcriptional regulator, penicillinase repressor